MRRDPTVTVPQPRVGNHPRTVDAAEEHDLAARLVIRDRGFAARWKPAVVHVGGNGETDRCAWVRLRLPRVSRRLLAHAPTSTSTDATVRCRRRRRRTRVPTRPSAAATSTSGRLPASSRARRSSSNSIVQSFESNVAEIESETIERRVQRRLHGSFRTTHRATHLSDGQIGVKTQHDRQTLTRRQSPKARSITADVTTVPA